MSQWDLDLPEQLPLCITVVCFFCGISQVKFVKYSVHAGADPSWHSCPQILYKILKKTVKGNLWCRLYFPQAELFCLSIIHLHYVGGNKQKYHKNKYPIRLGVGRYSILKPFRNPSMAKRYLLNLILNLWPPSLALQPAHKALAISKKTVTFSFGWDSE